MTADPKVSPRPWSYEAKLSGSENHHGFVIRYKGSPWAVATVQPGDEDGYIGEANAAHIVCCVNAHDGLVEALATLIANAELIGDPRMYSTADCYAVPLDDIEAARAALAAAKEGA